jgi:holliday junction DNA helicase RuvB
MNSDATGASDRSDMHDIGMLAQRLLREAYEWTDLFDPIPEVAATVQPSPEPPLEEWQALTQAKSPRPTGWDGYVGNREAVAIIQEAIIAAQQQDRHLPHMLLYGAPGLGKSTLSRIIAESMGGPSFETTASTLETPLDVARLLLEMNAARQRTGQPSVLFIDEIHMLGQAKGRRAIDQESVFSLLEDFVFYHNVKGRSIESASSPTGTWMLTDTLLRVYPFTCIGATTDPGYLNDAVRRRFLLHVELQPYTDQEIATILQCSAARLGWVIDPAAADILSRYSRRNPGRSYQLLTAAQNRAVASGRPGITADAAEEVIQRLRLYPLGLTAVDIRVLKLLADRMPRGIGQAEMVRAAGIAASTFAAIVEPYLLFLGFIQTMSRREITSKGLAYLAENNLIDTNRAQTSARRGRPRGN